MESFYIGAPGGRRYCTLHRPATRLIKDAGVVLCQPIGHEYYRAHRACARLATQLAQQGFPVIRFDYYGTGDSEGERGHARLTDWIDDIVDVAMFLAATEKPASLVLAGLRFGATLAMLAAARLPAARTLVLWDPVDDGLRYVAALEHMHRDMLHDLERFIRLRDHASKANSELLGVEYGATLLQDIRGVDIAKEDDALHDKDIVLVRTDGQRDQAFDERMYARSRVRRHDAVTEGGDHGWVDARRIEAAVVAPAVADRIAMALHALHP